MKKRIVSFLLALVMAVSLLPVSAFAEDGAYTVAEDTTAQQGEDNSKVTVYFSLSDNGKYKTGTSGKTLAYVPVTVEYFDLDDYGLGNPPVRTRASSLRCCTCSSKCWSRST